MVAASAVGMAMLVMLTGCLDATMTARIDRDGSGTLAAEILFSEGLVELLEALDEAEGIGGSPSEMFNDVEESVPPEYRDKVRVSQVDDGLGLRVEIDFDDVAELNELLGAAVEDGGAVISDVQWDADDERAVFSARAAGAEVFSQGDQELAAVFSEMAGLGDPTVRFAVEMPGPVRDSNADEVDGRVARWDLVASAGTELRVESDPTPGLLTVRNGLIAGGAMLSLVALLLVVRATRRGARRRRTAVGAPQVPPGGSGIPVPGNAAPPLPGWGPSQTVEAPAQPTAPIATLPPLGSVPPAVVPPAVVPPAVVPPAVVPPAVVPPAVVPPAVVPPGVVSPPTPPPYVPPVDVAPPYVPEAQAAAAQEAPVAPPVAELPVGPPAGWYDDPAGGGGKRWWDGVAWTHEVR
jgi:hypothetical protein